MKIFILITILFTTLSIQAECLDPVNCLSEIQEATTSIGPVNGCSLEETEADDPLPVTSQDLEKGKKVLDKDAWKYTLFGVGLAPGAFVAGAALHEGSHCLAAEMMDYDCYNLKLFPYRDESGYLYFASMNYIAPEGATYSPTDSALITATPMFTNAGLISIYSTLAFTDSLPKNKWAKTATLVLGASQVVDLANHISNTHIKSDSGKLIHYMKNEHGLNNKQSYWAVKGPQIGFTLLGASALALEGVRIFTNPSEKTSEQGIRVIPSVGQSSVHLGISGQF